MAERTEKIILRLPVRDIKINQPWGVNFVDFYQQIGMKGHNGIDFKAKHGCPVYAAHDGVILTAGTDGQGGNLVQIWDEANSFKTLYYHLLDWTVTQGQEVKAGDLIGHTDNTGLMTTGDHLHFGLKETIEGGNTKYPNNGYNGCMDPSPYFNQTFNGVDINNKDWDKSRSYHGYYRGRPAGGYINELKVIPSMTRRLKRLPNNEEINACVYGGWDIEAILNPAMWENWSQLKKVEYLNGFRPFN